MQEISWNEFKRKNKNPQQSFEDLCYLLFCRDTNQPGGIFGYKNQTGIEREPILFKKRWLGFQAKFFESQINWTKIRESVKGAKSKNPKLQTVWVYLNLEFAESSLKTKKQSKAQSETEEQAKALGVQLVWITPSQLVAALSRPSNLDLAQLYFGVADEFGFISDGISPEIHTFLQSEEHMALPLAREGVVLASPITSILRSKQKSFLVAGHPGSGKSVYMHSLFREFSGLTQATEAQMFRKLVANGAIPMIINLKNCATESLESLIRGRQTDSNIRGRNLGFIYLLDGLDELSEERAEQILAYVKELEQLEKTKKVVISCRSGNINRLKVGLYLNNISELTFCDLSNEFIFSFFKTKENGRKLGLLTKLSKVNPKIVSEVKDILLVSLLWDTIENLSDKSTVADLIEKKVKLLLRDPKHKKNIDNLNLLDTKATVITSLNQDISFKFQQKFQFRFPHQELQEIILDRFPRLDYKAVNEIVNYLATIFFESSYDGDDPSPGYIYSHRRYQEFFFTQRLKSEYEANPKILRELDILSNRDFFENFFISYLRKEYEAREDIVGLLDINLIDVYLGNHSGYGVDTSYYLNSSEFIPALASQNPYFIEELLDSENFQVGRILFVNLTTLRSQFEKWKVNKSDFRANDYIAAIWSGGIGSLLEHICIFWKAGNKVVASRLLDNLKETRALFEEYEYFENRNSEHPLDDPFWKHWGDYLFILIEIRQSNVLRILNEKVRIHYPNFQEDDNFSRRTNEGKHKLVSSFFNAVLRTRPATISREVQNLDDFEFLSLLRSLMSYDNLHIIIRNRPLARAIRASLEGRDIIFSEENHHFFFFKTLLNIPLSEAEISALNTFLSSLREKRHVDWRFDDVPNKFAVTSFALNRNNFTDQKADVTEVFRYYDELGVHSALFASFIQLLQKEISIGEIAREFISFTNTRDQRLGHYLKVDNSFLWAHIFNEASDSTELDNLVALKTRLLQPDFNLIPYSFYYKLSLTNKKFFNRLVNEGDLSLTEASLSKKGDYQTLVDECFALSTCFSGINDEKSREYFIRGLKESVVRHGWRKDTLVSFQLVDALEILWKNSWDTKENLVKATWEVFKLTLRIAEFTDGKSTWQGPFNVIHFIAQYDIELAVSLKDHLLEQEGYSSIRTGNLARTSILLGRVRQGDPLEEIEEGMRELRKDYDYQRRPESESYDWKIKVYLAILDSDLYSLEEKNDCLDKAYALVEEMKAEGLDYYLRDDYFGRLRKPYVEELIKFNREINVSPEDETITYGSDRSDVPEEKILREIPLLKTRSKISGFYKRLENYKNNIVLTKWETWQLLLKQTYKVRGDIEPLIKLLERFSFPHTDFYTSNSKYFHIPLAIALADINMRPAAKKHLYRNTGHGGFINVMKSYELLGDKNMCRKLFNRYLQLCHFLSE